MTKRKIEIVKDRSRTYAHDGAYWRGYKAIMVNGEMWGRAVPHFHGRHGVSYAILHLHGAAVFYDGSLAEAHVAAKVAELIRLKVFLSPAQIAANEKAATEKAARARKVRIARNRKRFAKKAESLLLAKDYLRDEAEIEVIVDAMLWAQSQ